MKILIIRHADPDYSIDSLTETGWEEARLLVPRMEKLEVKNFYVSPLGRAQDTASLTLKAMNRTAETLPWLQEFGPRITKPGEDYGTCCWDWLPELWTKDPRCFDRDAWLETEFAAPFDIRSHINWVYDSFDALVAAHGYVREGDYYRAEQPNEDTIVFFCHYGLECVLLSRLLNISPMALWHGICAAPTSVTSVVTEERRPGIAYFRMNAMGDTSHLYAAGREPSFSARFCEVYTRMDQRHD